MAGGYQENTAVWVALDSSNNAYKDQAYFISQALTLNQIVASAELWEMPTGPSLN